VKQVAAVHGYTTAFEVSAALVAASAVVASIFIGPRATTCWRARVPIPWPSNVNQPSPHNQYFFTDASKWHN